MSFLDNNTGYAYNRTYVDIETIVVEGTSSKRFSTETISSQEIESLVKIGP